MGNSVLWRCFIDCHTRIWDKNFKTWTGHRTSWANVSKNFINFRISVKREIRNYSFWNFWSLYWISNFKFINFDCKLELHVKTKYRNFISISILGVLLLGSDDYFFFVRCYFQNLNSFHKRKYIISKRLFKKDFCTSFLKKKIQLLGSRFLDVSNSFGKIPVPDYDIPINFLVPRKFGLFFR